jgi:uncharacterized Zn-binding protein involved in type VI secretion
MALNGKPAARKGDPTAHGGDLGDGPGSPNVLIGGQRAWRAKEEKEEDEKEEGDEDEGEGDKADGDEAGGDKAEGDQPGEGATEGAGKAEGEGEGEEGGDLGELVDKIQEQMEHVKAVLEVISKARELAKKDPPPKPGEPPEPPDESKGIEFGKSIFELVKEFKQVFAPTEPDDHTCPLPAHGTGKTKATQKNVLVNNCPLGREGDKVDEPGGGEDEIVEGCSSVLVGDDNKVIELAEKIGGLMDFINTAKDALAPDEKEPETPEPKTPKTPKTPSGP